MVGPDIAELLLEREAVTQDVVARAALVPPHVSTTLVGRLIAAGADADRLVRAVAEIVGLPVASRVLVASAAQVPLPQPIARTLRELGACPVRRDQRGTLQVVIGDPAARGAVEELLPGCQLHLAPEPQVRQLLAELVPLGSSIPEGMPVEGFDIDLEASSRLPAAPAPLPQDPLAPRASGSIKVRRPVDDGDETLRIPRSPRSVPPALAVAAALDEPTTEGAAAPAAITVVVAAARRRWFLYGVGTGAAAMALLAALVLVAILGMR